MRRILIFPLLVLILTLSACDLINPDEDAPGFIQVDSITFNPSPTAGTTGSSASTNIKDVWVYIDNEFQGVYELPAKFPVLKNRGRKCYFKSGNIFKRNFGNPFSISIL